MEDERREILVDCDAGRRLGCASYCCRLLVRLHPDERTEIDPTSGVKKGYVDKTREGLCVYFDSDTRRCGCWESRPRVCREFDCNTDPLLQLVLRNGFTTLTELVSTPCDVPHEHWRHVPSSRDDH